MNRILHVTESMGGGIVTFIDSITRRQAQAGATVSVLYSVRGDTPSEATLRDRLDSRVVASAIDRGSTWRNVWCLFSGVREVLRSGTYDVVHLHSSIAGAVGRLAALTVRSRKTAVVYSPHGFAFLREDVSKPVRFVTWLVERALSDAGGLILTSASEVHLSRRALAARDPRFLQSGVPRSSVASRGVSARGLPTVLMTGRMVYQKAPWRFAAVARALGEEARFIWVGGGDAEAIRKWIGDAPVEVLPWVSPSDLDGIFQEADVFLFPTLWEGMALSLIQAAARGIPAVTSDVVGNRDAVLHGVTGFVCEDDEQLVDATRRLLADSDLRARMGEAAAAWAVEKLIDDNIGIDSMAIYEDLLEVSGRKQGND